MSIHQKLIRGFEVGFLEFAILRKILIIIRAFRLLSGGFIVRSKHSLYRQPFLGIRETLNKWARVWYSGIYISQRDLFQRNAYFSLYTKLFTVWKISNPNLRAFIRYNEFNSTSTNAWGTSSRNSFVLADIRWNLIYIREPKILLFFVILLYRLPSTLRCMRWSRRSFSETRNRSKSRFFSCFFFLRYVTR